MGRGIKYGMAGYAAIGNTMIDLTYLYVDRLRLLAAFCIVASYAALCLYKYCQSKMSGTVSKRVASAPESEAEPIWIVYASQTGQAEAIARQTAHALAADNRQIHVCRIEEDWLADVPPICSVLFVVSTYGAGSAPDHALRFVHAKMGGESRHELRGMRYGLLALGDKNYPAFCAFGRQLDAWLQAFGARPAFDRIEADRLDPNALSYWQQQLNVLWTAEISASVSKAPEYLPWTFVARRCLNVGSSGNLVFLIELQAKSVGCHEWQAGDLVDILTPDGDGRPRTYSIANLPFNGKIELIVRQHTRDNGQIGQTSGWLTEQAVTNDQVALKIRSNPSFHLQHDLLRPLILIGAGAGIAGLRAHLYARAKVIEASGNPAPTHSAWLFFGERSGRHDHLCELEIDAWKHSRVLTRVDMSFSRDDPVTPYVQHNLLVQSKEVCGWIERGAQILICGNAEKMASGVDKALRHMLGSKQVDLLFESGRICRDVF